MTRRVAVTLVAASALLAARPLEGQSDHRRGFWVETGGGLGAIRVSCTGCADLTRAGGSSGYLRLGGRLSPKVLFGVESFSYVNEEFFLASNEPTEAEVASFGAMVLWYPGRSGFFLKGSLGVADGDFTIAAAADEARRIRGVGVGLGFGLGYDLSLTRWLALTGNAGAFITGIGDLVLPDTRVEDVIATLYQLSVGITIR